MSDYQARFDRLAGKIIDFRLRPPTGPYRTFFTPNVVGNVNRILGHSVPRSYAISTEPWPHSEDRALDAPIPVFWLTSAFRRQSSEIIRTVL